MPTYLVDTYQLLTNATGFTLFDTTDGAESLFFPLPVRIASSKRLVPLWQVSGARIRNPHPSWDLKRIEYDNDVMSACVNEVVSEDVNKEVSDYIAPDGSASPDSW